MVDMMGKLWIDTSLGKRTIDECIQAAMASYRRAFGRQADICYINPATCADPPGDIDGVHIALLDNVLKYHYWIGESNGHEGEDVEDTEPEPIQPQPFRKCPRCDAEQLPTMDGLTCWDCGYKEAA